MSPYTDPGEATPARKRRPMGGPVAPTEPPGLFDTPIDAPDVLPYSKALDGEKNSQKAALKLAPRAAGIRLTILRDLIAHGPGTRTELAARTGIIRDTINGGSGCHWLNAHGYTTIQGSRDGEGIVCWTGKQP